MLYLKTSSTNQLHKLPSVNWLPFLIKKTLDLTSNPVTHGFCKTSIFQSWILFLKSSNNQTDLNPYFRIKMLAIKKQVLAPLPDHFVSSDDSLILIVFKPFYTLIIVLNENRSALRPIKFPEPLIK